ncbi:formylglycine-generating enzyme family protein [Ilyomonas limi]|uniref:Formylglycine-generating enzyme family protein n=1 Tax=Ilyomonas limi TaxID=2575867 RepID=A0A4U3L5Y5_9BACT|nr:formylglycine-generating enzyme family protein [Ilyomonas limi]TKK69764.1 formylglycine-generating enzyme family protein [Ilyomonas limi]
MKLKPTSIIAACSILFSASALHAQDSTFTNSIGMEFTLIKPGSFVMGRFQPPYPKPPSDTVKAGAQSGAERGYNAEEYKLAEKLAKQDALPGFTVNIKKPFYIGKFEVTQAQWKKVMGSNPSVFQGDKVLDSANNHPVENVTWEDAQQFLNKLTGMEKGRTYRLPTEFEWEYAARAGATSDIPWSQIRKTAQLGTRTTNKIGQKEANAWGLYDMLGNVWEWVQDFYNEKIFADAVPPATGNVHVLKGASFVGDVKNATYMTHAAGPGNGWDVGFRVVMEATK